ncbi:hypothetical protein [Flexivirga alba]|uniref:Uncharacterized protein n=1 Tax=Flexivirga alba TaxID=702742 RepID=A0ABW2AID9_9MICO
MSRHLGIWPKLETCGGAARIVGKFDWSTVIRTDHGAETAVRRIAQAVVDATAADPTRPGASGPSRH